MASPALTLRPATAEDYPDVAALYRQFARTRHLEQFTFKGWLGQCHLAVEDGQVIGYWHGTHDAQTWLSFTVDSTPPEDWTVSYLTVMVVDQRHRRRGIGGLLLKDFLDQARAAGNTWAVLNPTPDAPCQTEAELIAFYAHHGFTLLEHDLDHGFTRSWMMGRALVEDPQYVLRALPQDQRAGRA